MVDELVPIHPEEVGDRSCGFRFRCRCSAQAPSAAPPAPTTAPHHVGAAGINSPVDECRQGHEYSHVRVNPWSFSLVRAACCLSSYRSPQFEAGSEVTIEYKDRRMGIRDWSPASWCGSADLRHVDHSAGFRRDASGALVTRSARGCWIVRRVVVGGVEAPLPFSRLPGAHRCRTDSAVEHQEPLFERSGAHQTEKITLVVALNGGIGSVCSVRGRPSSFRADHVRAHAATFVIRCWLINAFDVSTTPSDNRRSTGRQIANSAMLWPWLDRRVDPARAV